MTLRALGASRAVQARWNRACGVDAGRACDFSHIGGGKDDALAISGALLYFIDHRWNGAVEARGRTRVECKRFITIDAEVRVSDSQALDVDARCVLESLVPFFRREIN